MQNDCRDCGSISVLHLSEFLPGHRQEVVCISPSLLTTSLALLACLVPFLLTVVSVLRLSCRWFRSIIGELTMPVKR